MRGKISSNKKLVFTLFSVIAFLIYFNSLNVPFQLDDFRNISKNPDIKIADLSPGTLAAAANTRIAGFRPVSYLSFALNYFISGSDTTSYHVVNVLIHIIIAFLIYLIILQMFDYESSGDDKKELLAISAFFSALIWLVTPANSQAVIYIVQRMTSLMTLFFLLSFLCYIKGRKGGKKLLFAFSLIFFILSVLSKQNGITLPVVIILYEFVFVHKGDLKSITKQEKLLLCAVAAVLILTLLPFSTRIASSVSKGYDTRDFTLTERLITQPRILILYLSLLILPLPGRLCVTHNIMKSTSLTSPVTTLFSIIIILGALVFAILRVKKSPYLSFAILWFFVTIFVESSFIPLELVFEHRMYLPGVFLIAAAVDSLSCRLYLKKKAVFIVILCGISILFSIFTVIRTEAWRSELAIWSDVAKKYPEDGRAHFNVSTTYMKSEMYKEAEPYIVKAIEQKIAYPNRFPQYTLSLSYQRLGTIEMNLKRYDEAEQNFFNAKKYENDSPLVYNNIGLLYYEQQKYEEALTFFNQAVKLIDGYVSLVPDYDSVKMTAELYTQIGIVHYQLGEKEKAKQLFLKAITTKADHAEAYKNLGGYYFNESDFDKAIEQYKKAIHHDPDSADSHKNIGKAYYFTKNYDKAKEHLGKAVKLNPDDYESYNSLGAVYGLQGDHKNAYEHFKAALRLRPGDERIKRNIQAAEEKLR